MTSGVLFGLGVFLAALAAYVYRARPENAIHRHFAVLTLALGGWIIGIGGLQLHTHLEEWGRFTFGTVSVTPAAFFAFVAVFPTRTPWASSRVVRIALTIGAAFALGSLLTPLVVHDVLLAPNGVNRRPGPLYPLFAAYMLVGWSVSLAVLVAKWRHARGLARAQLQYLSIGLLILAGGAITTNLLIPLVTGRSSYASLGPFFAVPLILLVCHAIIRHRLMDLRLVINRSLAYLLATAILSTLLVVVYRLALPTPEAQSFTVQTDVLVVALAAAVIMSTPCRRLLSSAIDPYLYRGRMEHGSALRHATHDLSRLAQPEELAVQVASILEQVLVPESFCMMSRHADSGPLEPIGGGCNTLLTLLNDSRVAADAIAAQPSPSVVVVNPARADDERSRLTHQALRDAGIEVVVTLGRRGRQLGAVFLGPRRSGDTYFTKDLAFLESVAELASISLENGLLYRQRLQMLDYSNRLLEALDTAVLAVDVSGRVTNFNAAAHALLGLGEGDIGHDLTVLPAEIGWALTFTISGRHVTREMEATIEDRRGGATPVVLSTAVLRDHEQRIAGALVVITDLSAIKALERRQRRFEHLATMAKFYAGIAHEIRTPLASISNFIAMLPDRFDDPDYRDAVTRLLPLEVTRIVRLSDGLRLMAPSEHASLTEVSISSLFRDLLAIHGSPAEPRGIKLVLDCPETLPSIRGDHGQLVQLFVNLLNNAIEAMPHGGTITIQASHVPGQAKDGVSVRVIDEGAGLDPSIRAKIFEPFFTTKSIGTGLGLSICQEIAQFHHATLSLLPRVDRPGTIAHVEFPPSQPDLAESEAGASEDVRTPAGQATVDLRRD